LAGIKLERPIGTIMRKQKLRPIYWLYRFSFGMLFLNSSFSGRLGGSEKATLKLGFLYTEDLKVKAEGPECVSLLLLFTPTIKSFNSEGGGEKKRSPCN